MLAKYFSFDACMLPLGKVSIGDRQWRQRVGLATTERLAKNMEDGGWKRDKTGAALLVAESGIHTHSDVQRVAKAGAGAILVGESLVKHGNIGAKVRELLVGN